MPPRCNNKLPIDTTEGNNVEASHTVELSLVTIFPHNKTGTQTPEQLYTLMQSLTQYIAIMTDQHRVTLACLDAIVSTRALAGQNPQNPNLANSTENDQAQARVPPIASHASAPPMAPADIDPKFHKHKIP